VHLVNPPATSISQTIIDAINALPPIPVVVTPVATCDAGLTATNSPPTQTVPSGSTATFTETIAVSPAAPLGSTLHCDVDFTINGASAGPEFVQHVTVEVGHGLPFKLELTPETATNVVDDTHCVTATVTDAFGAPVPNTAVDFAVAGSVVTSGTRTTNGSGQAEFCYTGPSFPGADVITATAQAGAHPTDTARKTWVLPGSTEGCKVTGGGRITAANGDKATFGGNAKGSGPSGEEEYQDHGVAADINVHSTSVTVVSCSTDRTTATIFGTTTVNGSGSYDFRIDVNDLGEPGSTDRYRMRVANGYDSGDQQLGSGNIQIH
jgi:Bacterial Ig-like domain (group 1)